MFLRRLTKMNLKQLFYPAVNRKCYMHSKRSIVRIYYVQSSNTLSKSTGSFSILHTHTQISNRPNFPINVIYFCSTYPFVSSAAYSIPWSFIYIFMSLRYSNIKRLAKDRQTKTLAEVGQLFYLAYFIHVFLYYS